MSQPSVTLPYRSPRERAIERAKQETIDSGIMLGVVLLGMLVAFLEAGAFAPEAWRAFGLLVAVTIGKAAISVLLHFQRARAQDAALSQ